MSSTTGGDELLASPGVESGRWRAGRHLGDDEGAVSRRMWIRARAARAARIPSRVLTAALPAPAGLSRARASAGRVSRHVHHARREERAEARRGGRAAPREPAAAPARRGGARAQEDLRDQGAHGRDPLAQEAQHGAPAEQDELPDGARAQRVDRAEAHHGSAHRFEEERFRLVRLVLCVPLFLSLLLSGFAAASRARAQSRTARARSRAGKRWSSAPARLRRAPSASRCRR